MRSSRILGGFVLLVLTVSQLACCDLWSGPGILPLEFEPTGTPNEQTFSATASAAYAEDCDAFASLLIGTTITDQAEYSSYNTCEYYLMVTNSLANQDVWVWLHHLHATQGGIDRDEWDSATLEAGTLEEWSFSGLFNNDGTFGHSYVSEIAAILAVPECNGMRSRTNAIPLAHAVAWFCGP